MNILETERLILREIVEQDAEFIYDLVNQPSLSNTSATATFIRLKRRANLLKTVTVKVTAIMDSVYIRLN
jgi:hypothetical protein